MPQKNNTKDLCWRKIKRFPMFELFIYAFDLPCNCCGCCGCCNWFVCCKLVLLLNSMPFISMAAEQLSSAVTGSDGDWPLVVCFLRFFSNT